MPGPVPAGTLRLQIDYSLLNGTEIAVNTLHFKLSGATWEQGWVSAGDLMSGVASAFVTNWATMSGVVSSKAKVKDLKLYALNPLTGDADDEQVHTFTSDEVTVGGSSSTLLPPTVAPVVQMWGYDPAGFVPHRRARRGRLFMPGCTTSVMDTSTGMVDTSNGAVLVGGWKGFLKACAGLSVAGTTLTPIVLSRKYQLQSAIEAVSLSDHFGHQSRRQDALVYHHSSPVLVAS